MAERKNGLWSDLVEIMIGLAFILGGAMSLQILGFIIVLDASNWRDAYTSADGSPTWWEAFQMIGFVHPGTILYLSLPCTAVIYGFYYSVSAVKKIQESRAVRSLQ